MTAINYDVSIYVYTSLNDNFYQLYYIFVKEKAINDQNLKDIIFLEFNNNNHYNILIHNFFISLTQQPLNKNINLSENSNSIENSLSNYKINNKNLITELDKNNDFINENEKEDSKHMKISIENNINKCKNIYFKNDYKVNNSEAKEIEFIETKKVKYDASIPKYSNFENYYEEYNYYADIHQYYLLKKKNIANLCLYPDYINNIKNKEQRKNKKNNFRTKTSN